MNIIDLFTKEELTETSSGYKTICPHCGLQGGRTEGFIIFSESDTAYCHSSGKWFNLFQVVCLKLGLIQCIEGNEKGESPNIEKEDYIEQIKEAKGEEFLNDLQSSIEDIFDFLIAEVIGNKITYKVDIDKVSDHIIKNFDIKTITGIKNDDIYTYKDGVWMLKGRGLIKAEAEQLLGRYAKNNIVYEIKPESELQDKIVIAKESSLKKWCHNNNYEYKLITDKWFFKNADKINYIIYDQKIYKGMKQFLNEN